MLARFILRALAAAVGLWIASRLVHGIHVDGLKNLVIAALLLGLVNAIVRPIVFLLTLPFTLITFGLFLLVINAAMLELVAMIFHGFSVASFWDAVLASLVISLVSWVGSWFIHQSED